MSHVAQLPGAAPATRCRLAKFWGTTMISPVYQYALELDGGRRRTSTSALQRADRRGHGQRLPLGQWSHLAVVVRHADEATFYVNGNGGEDRSARRTPSRPRDTVLLTGADIRPASTSGAASTTCASTTGPRPGWRCSDGHEHAAGRRRPTRGRRRSDHLAGGRRVGVAARRTITADASDDVGVAGVQFYVDGAAQAPRTRPRPTRPWDTRTVAERRAHADRASARRGRQHDAVGARHRERRQRRLLPERGARDRVRPADEHRVPAERAHARRRAGGQDQAPAAAVHHAGPDAVPPAHQRRQRPACSRACSTSRSTRTSPPTTTTTSSTRSGRRTRDRLSRFTANADLTGTVAGQRARPLPGSAGRQ